MGKVTRLDERAEEGAAAGDAAPIIDRADLTAPTLPQLMELRAAPRVWFLADLVPEGAFLVVGRPKIGKSWLLQQMLYAMTRGEDFLGFRCLGPTGVLYIGAEDDVVRAQERAHILGNPPPRFHLVIEDQFMAWARKYGATVSLVGFLDAWLAGNPGVKAVVVDTESTCRAIWAGEKPPRQTDARQTDYAQTREFDQLARKHHAFIALVNHTAKRKAGADVDIHELINRTNVALAGASGSIVLADPAASIGAEDDDRILMLGARGRDLRREVLLAVTRDEGAAEFRTLGDWAAFARNASERLILEALADLDREAPGSWVKARTLGESIGKREGTVRQTMARMLKAGRRSFQGREIEAKTSRGYRFVHNVAAASGREPWDDD